QFRPLLTFLNARIDDLHIAFIGDDGDACRLVAMGRDAGGDIVGAGVVSFAIGAVFAGGDDADAGRAFTVGNDSRGVLVGGERLVVVGGRPDAEGSMPPGDDMAMIFVHGDGLVRVRIGDETVRAFARQRSI